MTTTQDAPSYLEGLLDTTVAPTDPPRDPADAAITEWSTGLKAAFRDQRVVLYVLSEPDGGAVEVLDLTHQRFRKVATTSVVPARPDDPAITIEQFKWLGEWLSGQRAGARRGAQRGLNNGQWSKAGMNETLAKLDIAPRVQRLVNGSIELSFGVRLPAGTAEPSRTVLTQILRQALVKDHGGIEITSINTPYIHNRWVDENV